MKKKYAIFAFRGELMCFAHALLNADDLSSQGYTVKVIIEGAAVKLIPDLSESSKPFSEIYQKLLKNGNIECACKACSAKMGVLDKITQLEIPLYDEMHGHPAFRTWIEKGYEIISM